MEYFVAFSLHSTSQVIQNRKTATTFELSCSHCLAVTDWLAVTASPTSPFSQYGLGEQRAVAGPRLSRLLACPDRGLAQDCGKL